MPYWSEALAVSLRFILWFLLLPILMLPSSVKGIDRFALGFGAFAAISVVIMQLLSVANLYDPLAFFGLVFSLVGLSLSRVRLHGAPFGQTIIRLLDDLEDQRGRLLNGLRKYLTRQLVWLRDRLHRVTTFEIITAPLGLILLGWAVWLRFVPYLQFSYLGAADAYVHLTWTKYLEHHAMYLDGVFPYGYHAIMAALGSLTFLDRFLIFRFIGPIGGVLLVLSVVYAAIKLRMGAAAVLTVLALFGLGFDGPLPVTSYRQAHPFPLEFSTIFVLPAVVFSWQYLQSYVRLPLLAATIATFLVASIHPYALVGLIPAVVIFVLCALATGLTRWLQAIRLLACLIGASVAGMVPMAVGRLLGLPWDSAFVAGLFRVHPSWQATAVNGWFSNNMVLNVGLGLGLCLLLVGIAMAVRGERERGPLSMAIGVLVMLLFTQVNGYRSLPVILEPNFAALLFSLVFSLAIGLGLDLLLFSGHAAREAQVVIVYLVVTGLVILWRPLPAQSQQLEYEDAIKAYQSIVENFLRFHWTIVAPTEQRSQALFVGWHEELGRFLLQVDEEQIQDPEFELYIPTPEVFLYVEKIPLFNTTPIEPDSDAPVNFEGIEVPEILWQRYQMPDQRRYMQQRLWALAEAYAKAHPTEVTIFFESDRLRVYRIHRSRDDKPFLESPDSLLSLP